MTPYLEPDPTHPEAPTLAAFLLARLAEDEAVAKAAVAGPWEYENAPNGFAPMVTTSTGIIVANTFDKPDLPDAEHIARHDPARVLADVAAKRRIVEDPLVHDFLTGKGISTAGHRLLRYLAQPYAEHPDFRPEWRT